MNTFDSGGHLTDAALQAFLSGGPLTELERLEIAEHLDFCDACLLRSMERMPCEVLLTPAHSCQRTLWPRIHRRSARELAGRIATVRRIFPSKRNSLTEPLVRALRGLARCLNSAKKPQIK